MNHAFIPNTVAAPARTMKIHRLSWTSGHLYRRRVSRTYISVPAMTVAFGRRARWSLDDLCRVSGRRDVSLVTTKS